MNCRKCGAELHPDQKVCIHCGERTAAGGKFDVDEEQHWRPTPKQMYIAGGIVALLLVIFLAHKVLYVTPPEQVAGKWFDAMVHRELSIARNYVTPRVEQELSTRMMDLRALADDYCSDITSNNGTYTVSPPAFDSPTTPKRADITITVNYAGGNGGREVRVQMAKVGRAWRIDRVM